MTHMYVGGNYLFTSFDVRKALFCPGNVGALVFHNCQVKAADLRLVDLMVVAQNFFPFQLETCINN